MDRVIYTAMTAASQSLVRQAITSNNLANVSTPGFRAQLSIMKAVPIKGDSLATRTLVSTTTPTFDATMGDTNYTGRELDVALEADHWLAVQLPDGSEAYTRHGNIQVAPTGELIVQGRPLLGDNGLLTVPLNATLSIGTDGTLSALGAGSSPDSMAQVGKIKRVHIDPTEMRRGDDGLFHLTQQAQRARGQTLDDNPSTRLMSGVLEGSNVNAVSSLVALISQAREFEQQMRVIQNANENAQKSNQILSLS